MHEAQSALLGEPPFIVPRVLADSSGCPTLTPSCWYLGLRPEVGGKGHSIFCWHLVVTLCSGFQISIDRCALHRWHAICELSATRISASEKVPCRRQRGHATLREGAKSVRRTRPRPQRLPCTEASVGCERERHVGLACPWALAQGGPRVLSATSGTSVRQIPRYSQGAHSGCNE